MKFIKASFICTYFIQTVLLLGQTSSIQDSIKLNALTISPELSPHRFEEGLTDYWFYRKHGYFPHELTITVEPNRFNYDSLPSIKVYSDTI